MSHVIVTTEEKERWQRRARLGWVTLGIGVALSICSSFGAGYSVAYRKALAEAEHVADRQEASARFLAQAWQDQRNGIDLVVATATYLRERDRVAQYNKDNKPQELPPSWKNRAREPVRLSQLSP